MALLIIGIILILYGLAILAIGSGTLFYLVWMAGGVFFILWGLLRRLGLAARLPAALRYGFFVLLGSGIAWILVCTCLILTRFSDKGSPGADYLIVLGAQVRTDGPSVVLRHRLDAAVTYLHENPDTLCIVSGGQSYNEPFAEAEGMAAYLAQQGVDPGRIILEDQSRDTAQNIRFSMELIDTSASSTQAAETSRICIVTNNFHLYRALGLAKKAGLANASGLAAYSIPFYLPNNILRECLGIAKDLLTGGL